MSPNEPSPSSPEHSAGHEARENEEASSLRGELRSILALYVIGAILPLLIGLIFGPESS